MSLRKIEVYLSDKIHKKQKMSTKNKLVTNFLLGAAGGMQNSKTL